MANNTHASSELHEFSSSDSEVEVIDSGSDSDWDDLEGDPDFEETNCNFSNLSLTSNSKSKAPIVKCKGLEDTEVQDITAPSIDDATFMKVEGIIKAGSLEKLKVDECKLYLRKNGLRLTGNKDVLIQRIREHQEIINGGGEKKYPPSSFVLNCKGDACVGDVVLFEQNVYEMFNIASRSASGPPCGTRVVAGRIVKESYGAAKQQHTFTIEVLWSKGEKPLPPLHPLLIKGRNLYRLKTQRQKWEDEGKRQNILMEKHSRGCVARAQREARIQEKEKRKAIRESRSGVSKKDSVRNNKQRQTLPSKPTSQETDTSLNPEKPPFSSKNSAFSANKPADTSKQYGKSINSGRVPVSVHSLQNHHQPRNHLADYGSTYGTDHIRRAELSSNYMYPDIHSREERTFRGKFYPLNAERERFTEMTHHRQPLTSANHSPDHIRRAELASNYMYPDIHSREERTFRGKFYPLNAERERFTEMRHHRQPLTSANHFPPLMNNRETYKQKQLCRHYARGVCYYGDNCKFLHDLN